MIWVLVFIAAAAIVGVWFAISRGPRQEPGMESFRRHIDALSPEARREVADRVRERQADDRDDRGNTDDNGDDGDDDQHDHGSGGR